MAGTVSVLFFLKYSRDIGSSRIRGFFMAEELQKLGITCDIVYGYDKNAYLKLRASLLRDRYLGSMSISIGEAEKSGEEGLIENETPETQCQDKESLEQALTLAGSPTERLILEELLRPSEKLQGYYKSLEDGGSGRSRYSLSEITRAICETHGIDEGAVKYGLSQIQKKIARRAKSW